VRTSQAWIEQAGIGSGPLFRSINRHGQVQPVRLAGIDVARVVKKLDRSVQMVRRYIRDGNLFRENSAGKLGL
jgi:hypothetical protein